MRQNYEILELITYDGQKYSLTDGGERFVLSTPGEWGMPPIDFQTRRAYKQDGVTEVSYRLNSRAFGISTRHRPGCSREDYWAMRAALLDTCRPNRGGQVTLTLKRADNTKRAIRGRFFSPTFPEVDNATWDEWGFTELLQFEAFDPIWFNPSVNSVTLHYFNYLTDDGGVILTDDSGNALVTAIPLSLGLTFPITFPIVFNSAGYFHQIEINYPGTWYSYPTFVVAGPFTRLRIRHEELGREIIYYGSIPVDKSLTLNLNNNTIIDSDSINRIGYLTPTSDLQALRIEPNPIVEDGINTLSFYLEDNDPANTEVQMSYYTRYIGI